MMNGLEDPILIYHIDNTILLINLNPFNGFFDSHLLMQFNTQVIMIED